MHKVHKISHTAAQAGVSLHELDFLSFIKSF